MTAQAGRARPLNVAGLPPAALELRESPRATRLTLRVDEDGEVWSGGQVQTVITGTLDW